MIFMDDKNIELLPIIDKTEFDETDFPDELNNKKAEVRKDGETNE